MALLRHAAMSELSLLSGVKRKLDFGAGRSESDPEGTSARPQNIFLSTNPEVFQLFSLDSYNDLILGGEYAAAGVHPACA
jgi:hypothetical protein